MSRVCEICGKTKKSGNTVTFSHRAIKRTWTPNLRRVRVFDENGTPKRIYVCTRCLRSGLVNRYRANEEAFAAEADMMVEAVEPSEAVAPEASDVESTEA